MPSPTSTFRSGFFLVLTSLLTLSVIAQSPEVVFLGTDPVTIGPAPLAAADIGTLGVDAVGNQYYANLVAGTVVEVTATGAQSTLISDLKGPSIAVDYRGNVFVADRGNNRILESAAGEKRKTSVLTAASAPRAITVDSADNVFYLSGTSLIELPNGGTPARVASVAGATTLAFGPALNGARHLYILSRKGSSSSAHLYSYTNGPGSLSGPISGFLPAVQSGTTISGLVVDPRGNAVVVSEGMGGAQVILGTSSGFESSIYTSQLAATPIAEDSNGSIYFLDGAGLERVQLGAVNFGTCRVPDHGAPCGSASEGMLNLNFGGPANATWSAEIYPVDSLHNEYGNFQLSCPYAPCDSYYYSSPSIQVSLIPNDSGPLTGTLTLTDQNNNKLNISLYGYGIEPFEAYYDPAPDLGRQTGSSKPVDIVILPMCGLSPPCGVTYVMDAATGQVGPVIGLKNPQKFTVDGDGNFYITQGGVAGVLVVAPDGSRKQIATDLANPIGVTLDGAHNLYVTNGDDIVKIQPDGSESLLLTPELDGGFKSPLSVTTDFQDNLYVGFASSPYYDRGAILKVTPAGAFEALHVNVLLPTALSANRDSVLFFTDAGKGTLNLYSSNRIQKSLAFGLKNPTGVAATKLGNVEVADSGLGNVLYVSAQSPSPRNFGNVPVGSSRTLTLTTVYVGTDPEPGLGGVQIQPQCSGDFFVNQTVYGSTLGELLNVPFTFQPQSTGQASCEMDLYDDDYYLNESPTPFLLYGNGVATP